MAPLLKEASALAAARKPREQKARDALTPEVEEEQQLPVAWDG